MRSNLSYITNGRVIDSAELPPRLQKNSIRHLAVSPDGMVAFGMQWQGAEYAETLVGVHQLGSPLALTKPNTEHMRDMQGYVGSIALSFDGETIAVTSPRGGKVLFYNANTLQFRSSQSIEDVCGVSSSTSGFKLTSGTGRLLFLVNNQIICQRKEAVKWDNHLILV